jgi:DNA-binding NarL/FixJ family response regulator
LFLDCKRILIADSHPSMMRGVHLLLKTKYDSIFMVADAPSLIDAVENSQFDLVIADLSLPVLPGEHIVKLLKRLRPELRLIVLSVHDESGVAAECLTAGATGFVIKRTAVNDLMPAVEAVLNGDTYISPCVGLGQKSCNGNSTDRIIER